MNKEYLVHLTFCTCTPNSKCSSDLFTINNKGLKFDQFNVYENNYFAKNEKNNFLKLSQQSDIKTERGESLIFRIRKSKNNTYTIENPLNKKMLQTINNINNLNGKLWYILNSTPYRDRNNKDDYIINKNDIIKFGTTKYEVIEKKINIINPKLRLYTENNYVISKINRKNGPIFKIKEIKKGEDSNNDENNCRICFDGSSTEENPKICLCNCHNYIHYQCLKNWLKTKIKLRSNKKKTVLSYYIKKFNCEVCTMTYPLKFKISGIEKEYPLVDIQLPEEDNYMVLESLGLMGNNNSHYKFIHVVKLIDETISFGRADNSDILDFSNNISKCHALFKYNIEYGDLFLENHSRNFHTLVLVKNPVELNKNKIDFQIGRTIITANLKKDNSNR